MGFGAVAGLYGRVPILARRLADIVLPPVCGNCRAAVAGDGALCPACWAGIRFIAPPYCAVLGTPFAYDIGEGALSADAIADPPPFARARAAVAYGDVARTLVHQFKYHDRTDLAGLLATAMVRAGGALIDDAERIVPVPLYRWRLWQRRFNQAAALGAEISERTGIAHDPTALVRVRATKRQVGLSPRQRSDNVRGAFRVPPAARIRIAGRRVLLVDDVYTSGATVRAATRALMRAGAGTVDVLTFARVLRG